MAKTSDRAVRVLANTFYVRLQGVTRLLLYLLLGGLLLVLEAFAVMFINRIVARFDTSAVRLLTYSAIALGAMIYLPLFARVRGVLDHALYHDTYELGDVLQQYSQKFGALSDQESITGYLLDSLEATINLAAIAYVALPEGLDAGVMQVLEAGDIYARGQYATEEGKAYMLAGLARLPGNSDMLLRQRNAMRNPWHGCEALVLIESVSGGSIAGLLVVGPKRRGGSLQRKDRSLLVTVAHLVGTAYANALLIQGLHVSLVQVQTATNQLMAARAELQLLLRELVSAEERERSALARDLHDDALQEVLYVIRHAQFCFRLAGELEASSYDEHLLADSQHAEMESERTTEPAIERLRAELGQLADRSLVLEKKLRALCMGLYPEALRVLGLPTALDELATHIARTTGMDTSVYYDDDAAHAAESLLPDRAVHLYRIAQEAWTNAGKHARASASVLYLSLLAPLPNGGNDSGRVAGGLWLCLTIIDNGEGMPLPLNMGTLIRSGHLGLAGMRERAEQLDGRFEIRREPHGGTRVTIMSPLHAAVESSGSENVDTRPSSESTQAASVVDEEE
ncbi:MAG TPA: ATP-binding protein [Ktedonobacterales bacterium]|jgi:signal transduction histidine kinase|nr:ATP-binding protein [Ktedonobacterales bacterium]